MSIQTKCLVVCGIVVLMLMQKTGLGDIFIVLFVWTPCLVVAALTVYASTFIAEKLRSPWISYLAIFFALYGFFRILATFPNYKEYSGPCSNVAPEDRAECISDYYAHPTYDPYEFARATARTELTESAWDQTVRVIEADTATALASCYRWDQVTPAMIGQWVCVTGRVYNWRAVGESTTQILFSPDAEAFFLASGTYYYSVKPGDCVMAKGQVYRSGAGVPYMDIDEALYHCQ